MTLLLTRYIRECGRFLLPKFLLAILKKTRAAYYRKALYKCFHKQEIPEWMSAQIEKDLAPYKESGISLKSLNEVIQEYINLVPHNAWELVRCRIQNGIIALLKPLPTKETQGRWEVMHQTLMHLSYMTPLPDIDFVMCIGDCLGPAPASFFKKYNIPVLTFAKHEEDTVSILIPDFEAFIEGFYENMLLDTSAGRIRFPWRVKKEKAFWRGATTGGTLEVHNYQEFPRIKIAHLSSKNPHLIDAKLTVLSQIKDPKVLKLLSPFVGNSAPILDHLKYKYQILIDGNTCTYSRAYWQLFSDCLIFKQTSPNIQWYYSCLTPYVHYIPVAYDFSDLKEKIKWAQNHDLEAQQMVAHANAFAQKNLKKQNIYLYLLLLLQKYAALQRSL